MFFQECQRIDHKTLCCMMEKNQVPRLRVHLDFVLLGPGKFIVECIWLATAEFAPAKSCIPCECQRKSVANKVRLELTISNAQEHRPAIIGCLHQMVDKSHCCAKGVEISGVPA